MDPEDTEFHCGEPISPDTDVQGVPIKPRSGDSAESSRNDPHGHAVRTMNNFNLLRFAAASLVMVSHGFELPSSATAHDWAYAVTGRALSWYAVNAFFVISGYLIFASWQRKPFLVSFLWARFLRIMPGLFTMLVSSVLILGICFSTLAFAEYIANRETVTYFVGCLSILYVKYVLPGVFGLNPIQAVNGSLWTLRFEIFCYSCVAIAGLAGVLRYTRLRRIALWIWTAFALSTLIWFDRRGLVQYAGKLGMVYELARLATCFLLGGLYYEYEDKVPLWSVVLIALFGLMLAVGRTPFFVPVAIIVTAYGTLWLAFVPNRKWIIWTRNAPDYSYGMYIYAYPVEQAVISLFPGITPGWIIVGSFGITMTFATLSWHLIEKPSLALKQLTMLSRLGKYTAIGKSRSSW